MKVSRNWSLIDTSIEEVSRNKPSDTRIEARSIHQLLRSYRGGKNFLDLSTRYREAVGKAIRNSWKSSTDSKASMRYRGGVEPACITSFSRCEKHWHECNPTCNSTNDPINILSSQKHLSIKLLWQITLPSLEIWRNDTHPETWKEKTLPSLRFEKNNTPSLLLILVTEYSNFLKDSLYQSLTMVSEKSIHIK